ncbi:MAG TPA: hypothetical protein DDZ34_05245 [Syntrophaceae bacterium]|jgi:hypothetical protein|nr:hypothetical protein [Syntrophaceae bacterium]
MDVIVIKADIVADHPIAPYDDAAAIVKSKSRIAVAECFCRKAVSLYGKTCKHPLETCLQFETFADYYVENKMARYISADEALAILKQSEAEGLVLHILNSRKVEAICCCCSCCCGLCVTTCPTGALALAKKPDDHLYTPPPTVYDTFARMSREKVEQTLE